MLRRVAVAGRLLEGALHRETYVGDIVETLPEIFLQAPLQAQTQCRGCVRRENSPVGLRLDHVGEHLGNAVPRERRRADQHLVEHAAERPDVSALVDRPSARLLGTHVRRGTEQNAVLRATHGVCR